MELVGVGISIRVFLEFIDHLGPVLEVLGGVKDLLLLFGCWLVLSLQSLLRGFFCLLLLQLLLLLQPLLLVFAELGAVPCALACLDGWFLLGLLRGLLNFLCLHLVIF